METSPTVFSVCGMCVARCPIEVELEDGMPRWICGNTHSELRGALCPRGAAGLALRQDDERPQRPLIRQGERGEGRWKEVDWEEALDYVSRQLKRTLAAHGPQSLLWSECPGPHTDMNKAFLRGLGSPNYCTHETTCAHNLDQAVWSLCGGGDRHQFMFDYRHCRHLVVPGRNIFESLDVREVNEVLEGMAQGCRLTAMDVRPTVTLAKAHDAFLVRPGSDYALHLAVLHVLVREGWYDKAYVRTRVQGFDALARCVELCTPQWAEQESGVPATRLEELARHLHEAAPAVIWHPGWMVARYAQSFMTCRAALLINILLGSMDRQGGLIHVGAENSLLQRLESLFPAPTAQRADGMDATSGCFHPETSLLHRALNTVNTQAPYAVKAYVAYLHDPLRALPDPQRLREWLNHLDFLVSATITWSDIAWHSDVVLPLSSHLEAAAPIFVRSGLPPRLLLQRQAVPPLQNTRAGWEIIGALAQRMGLKGLTFSHIEDLWSFQLQGTGYSEEDFAATGFVTLPSPAPDPQRPLPTPSGKLEMTADAWQKAGMEALRPYTAPVPPPPGHFRLVTGRVAGHSHANTQNNPLLHGPLPENSAWIHPQRATELRLGQDELVRIQAADGSQALVRVRITEGMHPEALFLLHGFGHKLQMESRAYGKGVADQEFMSGGLSREDPLSGGLALEEHFVTLHKIPRGFGEEEFL